MSARLVIKKVSGILSVFGLVLLLLLSPCKVRNFIQFELGIAQTKVSNKSQSTLSESNCQTFDTSKAIQSVLKTKVYHSDLWSPQVFIYGGAVYFKRHAFVSNTSINQRVCNVPLYILHQHLLVYS